MGTTHQDAAKSTVLEKLSSSQVFIIMDWAIKFLPVSFREWFGKKGKSWHLSAAITKSAEEELEVWIPIKNNDVKSDHGIGKDKKRSVKLLKVKPEFDRQSFLFLRYVMFNSLTLLLNKG